MDCAAVDTRPYVELEIYNQSFRALVDTGAAVSLIGDQVADLLRDQPSRPCSGDVEVRMANGVTSRAQSGFRICGKIAGVAYEWDALYVPGLTCDVVLGISQINELGLVQFEPAVVTDSGVDTESRFDTSAVCKLDDEQRAHLESFLAAELALFDRVKGKTHLVEHVIKLKEGAEPVKQRPYPRNPAMQEIIKKEVETMLENGIIETSNSPWSSNIVMVKKASGGLRPCVDLRRVNDASVRDAYPLPRINSILEKLKTARYISTLDLKQGYWQVPLSKESRPITAFTVPGMGLFAFAVMPFGLHSAGATFQRLLDKIIGPELEPRAFAYLDDLILVSKTFDEHLELLREVFGRLRDAGLRLNPSKCHFCKTELRYLGHIINDQGIGTDPEKVAAVRNFPQPTNVKSLRSFLGLASWYRRFVRDFATTSRPLTQLLRKNCSWRWGPEQEGAFQTLKQRLVSAPVLACPDFDKPFILNVDASNSGLGAALTQEADGKEVVIAYASRLLSEQEKNYSTTEKECLALVWSLKKFRPYLEGYHFTAVTDHSALKWLLKLPEPTGRLARWIMEIQQYDFEVKYRKGVLNRVADALSRQPEDLAAADVHTQPDNTVDRAGGDVVLQPRPADWYEEMLAKVRASPNKYSHHCIKSGKLFKTKSGKRKDGASWRLCVPRDQYNDVLRESHDLATAGHLGVKKTLARVGENYFWPGWRRTVKDYVRSCQKFQEYKVPQIKTAGRMYFRNRYFPPLVSTMEREGFGGPVEDVPARRPKSDDDVLKLTTSGVEVEGWEEQPVEPPASSRTVEEPVSLGPVASSPAIPEEPIRCALVEASPVAPRTPGTSLPPPAPRTPRYEPLPEDIRRSLRDNWVAPPTGRARRNLRWRVTRSDGTTFRINPEKLKRLDHIF